MDSLNVLRFNENKTEVMVFGGTTGTPLVDLGALAQYIKPNITNLGVKIDSDLKLDSQIRAVVKSSFFPIEAAGQNKAISSKPTLWDSNPCLCNHSARLL